MALENVTTGDFKTYLTKYGMNRLLNNKLNIKYFNISDEGINYLQTVDSNVLVKSITGEEIKTFYNGPSDLKFVGDVEPTTDIAKREVVFVNECNSTEYKNITATIYLDNYLQNLRDTLSNIGLVSNSYEPFVRLFDIVKIYEYVENAFGEYKLWNIKDSDLSYTFLSDTDYNTYKLFDNTHIVKSNTTTSVEYDSSRFKTPFKLTFSSYKADNGVVTQNGISKLMLYPVTSFGYSVDGSFIKPEELTQTVYDSYKNITPVVKFNNIIHNLKLDTTTVYKNCVNREIFRFENLLESAVTSAVNNFRFYGKESSTNTDIKTLTINFKVNLGTSESDGVNPKDANLKINLIMNTEDQGTWNGSGTIININ